MEEPCKGCADKQVDKYGYLCDLACGERRAWQNYQAGIKKVVEWIRDNELYWRSKSTTNHDYYIPLSLADTWQGKLKEWGI